MRFKKLVETILTEDIESMKKYYPNISDDAFQSYVELDPTYKDGSTQAGKYAKWILGLANKGKLDNIGHVKDVLSRFDEEKNNLKEKDIMKYKSVDEVEAMLNDENSYKALSDRQRLRQTQKAVHNTDLDQDAERLFNGKDWEVWTPHTYEASCKLGRGTQWCTASTESDHYFRSYTKSGKLYIIINKHNGEKYQFHFESASFMDAEDESIPLAKFLLDNRELNDYFYAILPDEVKEQIEDLKDLADNDYVFVYHGDIPQKMKYVFRYIEKIIVERDITKIPDKEFHKLIGLKEVSLHDNITYIGESAFEDCENLEYINLPHNLEHLGDYAFDGCVRLKSIKINSELQMLPMFAFSYTDAKRVDVPGNINVIGNGAFCNTELQTVVLNEGVQVISSHAFSGSDKLTSIKLPHSLNKIDSRAFRNCTSLQKIVIPKEVEYVGHRVFGNCPNLTVYCEAEEQPIRWETDWNHRAEVVWGYKGEGVKESYKMRFRLDESLTIEDVTSPEQLMDWMNDNITYELVDDEYSNSNGVPTKTAEEVLATKTGHCAEQSYLEQEVLDGLGYESFFVMVKENNSEKEYGAEGSAHLFLVYKDEDARYCWFEHSMQHSRGIHKYDSLYALLQDVAHQWWRYDENSDILEVRFIDKHITGVDNWGLAKECYKYPVEYTFDISNNVLEKDVPLEFDPPYNAEQIKKEYGEDTYNSLIDDPAHKWRMETGIELVHQEPDVEELRRIWANWLLMTPEQKAESDAKSVELFGKTNAEHFGELLPLYESVQPSSLYFLSDKDMNGQTLEPRVPSNYMTKNGYEDAETPRVCFANSIDGALKGLSQNLTGKEFYVHTPVDIDKEYLHTPSKEEVPDAHITTEVWYTQPVKVKTIGKIKVISDDGKEGLTYTYGDGESAELYGWNWEWDNKIEESLSDVASTISKEVQKYDDNGSNQNCMLCTWATELQSRGIDFLPRPVYSPRDVIFTLNGYDIVKEPVKQSIESKEDVITQVTDAGDGARFYCHVNWADSNGGHEFILANTDGKIMIVDSQSNYINDITSDSEYFEDINYENSFIVRLDNKEINNDILKYNDEEYITEWDDTLDGELLESLSTKIVRRDNPNDFSPFGYKVDFYDGKTHIGEGSVCGIKDDNAFLYDFEVYPEHRGKGYSKEMLQFMIDKYDLKQLYVQQDNIVAVNLYKKFGFKVEGEVEDNGKPAYDMIRESYKMRFKLTEGKNLEQTVQQYIDKYKKIVPAADDELHRSQVMGIIAIDPTYKEGSTTTGDYAIWLLNMAIKNGWDVIGTRDKLLPLLTDFIDKKSQLPNKDINSYKSAEDLEVALKNCTLTDRQKERRARNSYAKTKHVLSTENWDVYAALNYEGALTLGKGTSWCTATSDNAAWYVRYVTDTWSDQNYSSVEVRSLESEHLSFEEAIDASDLSPDTTIEDIYRDYSDRAVYSFCGDYGFFTNPNDIIDVRECDTLYVFVNKENSKFKYQFCMSYDLMEYEDDLEYAITFCDASDKSVSFRNFLNTNPELNKFWTEVIGKPLSELFYDEEEDDEV